MCVGPSVACMWILLKVEGSFVVWAARVGLHTPYRYHTATPPGICTALALPPSSKSIERRMMPRACLRARATLGGLAEEAEALVLPLLESARHLRPPCARYGVRAILSARTGREVLCAYVYMASSARILTGMRPRAVCLTSCRSASCDARAYARGGARTYGTGGAQRVACGVCAPICYFK